MSCRVVMVGSAGPALQAGGRWFEPSRAHPHRPGFRPWSLVLPWILDRCLRDRCGPWLPAVCRLMMHVERTAAVLGIHT